MKLEFSGQIFEEYSNIKFHENPSIGSQVVPCGQTDGQTDTQMDRYDEANTQFLQFVNVPKKVSILFLPFPTMDLTCDKFLFHNLCYYIFKCSYIVVWYWMRRKAAISGWRTGTRVSNEFICFEVIVTNYSKIIHKCRLNWQGKCTFIWQYVVTLKESNITSSGGLPTPFKVFQQAISMHLPRFYFRLAAA